MTKLCTDYYKRLVEHVDELVDMVHDMHVNMQTNDPHYGECMFLHGKAAHLRGYIDVLRQVYGEKEHNSEGQHERGCGTHRQPEVPTPPSTNATREPKASSDND